MTLGQKQELFSLLLVKLLNKAFELGFDVRCGHLMRCQNCYIGHKNSNHKKKLAIDLNLFKDGDFMTKSEDHKELGEYWESLHSLCRWGGRFKDANHYSLEHDGMK